MISPPGDGAAPRAHSSVASAGAMEAPAKPGSAGWMPSTRWTRSRVGVDDQPWLTVPPAHVSVHEVEHRFVAQRSQSSSCSGIRSERPAVARASWTM